MMLKDERQKGKITYKIWDIVVIVILTVLADCNESDEIVDYAKEEKEFLNKFLKLTSGITCNLLNCKCFLFFNIH